MKNYKNVKLKSLELFEDIINGDVRHLLKAVYECKNETGKYEIILPRIDLRIPDDRLPNFIEESSSGTLFSLSRQSYITVNGNTFVLESDKDQHTYYFKTIEEYPQKMTIEELEKKLGHKIELVSKK